jgi:hypothetical protein
MMDDKGNSMLDHSCQAQRHSHVERGHDLYETPAVAVEALLRVLALPSGAIWEPACGRGAIANVLRAHGHRVVCSDLIEYGADPSAIHGVDFLKTTKVPDGVSCIVTNPPYMLANEFTAHALELCPNVMMLLRLAFLESERRISWEDGRDAVPVLLPHGRPTKGSRAGSQIKRGANRPYVLARLRRDGRADLIEKVESGALSVRGALAAMTDKQTY